MTNDAVANVLSVLEEMKGDATLPKNVRAKMQQTIAILSEEHEDMSLRINKALHALDELTDESNLEPFTRTQMWNIVSMLEMIASQMNQQ